MSYWTGYANRLAVGCDLDLNRNPTHDDPNVAVIIHTYAATNYTYYSYDVGMAHSGDFGSGSTTRRMVNSQAQEFDAWNSWVTAQYGRSQYLVLNLSASGTDAGPVSGSWGITIPARPYGVPAAPTGLTGTRVSDTQSNLSWVNHATTGEPYGSVSVEWREETPVGTWTPWKQFAVLSGSASSYTDKATGPNHRYQYRVRASNSAGYSPYSNAVEVVETPGAPTGVTAAKQADGSILVGWTSGAPFTGSGFTILDNGVQVGTASPSATSWTHVSPDPAMPHTYTVRMTAGGLVSADSAPSPTIQLLTPPSAPTLVSPSGITVAAEVATVLTWRHNPVDSTAQTSAQVRYRVVGASSWTTVSATTSMQASVGVLGVGAYEWQARTRGLYKPTEEAGFGPWSAVTGFTVAATPQVVILTPANLSTINTSILAATWSYYQAAGHAQVSWEAELSDAQGAVLETRSGATADTAAVFTTRVLDGAAYTLRLRARSSDGLWSAWTSAAITVSYPQPPTPLVDVSWDEDLGTAVVAITNPEPLPTTVARTNLQKYPRTTATRSVVALASDSSGWGGEAATMSRVADPSAPSGGGYVTRLTHAAAATTGTGWLWYAQPDDRPPVTGGLPYALSVWVRPSFTMQARMIATWKTFDNASMVRTDQGPLVSLPVGVWTRVGAAFTAPTGAGIVVMSLGVAAGATYPAGATVDSDAALTEQALAAGTYFDGASGPNRVVDGQSYAVAWTGTADASTSTMTPNSPPALTNTVERSVDGGSTWEPVADSLPVGATISDPECLVGVETQYRVTAISALPSSSSVVVAFVAVSRSMWLTAGPGFQQVVRLPYNPSVGISAGLVEREVQHFAGRTLGVEMSGTARKRTVTIGSLLIEADPTSESSTSAAAEELAYAVAPILYRDPTGRRIYTSLSSLSVKRDHLLRWTLSATLEEVGRD